MWTDEDGLYMFMTGTRMNAWLFEHDVDFLEEVRKTVVKRRHEHIAEVCQQEARKLMFL